MTPFHPGRPRRHRTFTFRLLAAALLTAFMAAC